MNTSVEVSKSFEERMFEKIRADIGSLMTDEDLKKLVGTTMQRVFFTKREIPSQGGYYSQKNYAPPLIEELVQELIEPTLRKALLDWLEAHTAETQALIQRALAGGLTDSVARALDSRMSAAFGVLSDSLVQQLGGPR